jgi:hypothetical protein
MVGSHRWFAALRESVTNSKRTLDLAAAQADHLRQLFDSQVESFCRRLRTSGGRVCYHHSEGDSTALGRCSRQQPALGDNAIPFGGAPLTTDHT